jgi:hypothetical protein
VAGARPTCYHDGVRLFSTRRPPVHVLDESEAYARCHGHRGDQILSIVRLPPAPPPAPAASRATNGLTGESLRQAFEARLRARAHFK